MGQAPAPDHADLYLPGANDNTNMDVDRTTQFLRVQNIPKFDNGRQTRGFVTARDFIDFFDRLRIQRQWTDADVMKEVKAALHGTALDWFNAFGLWQSEEANKANLDVQTNWAIFEQEFRARYTPEDDINAVRWAEVFRQRINEPIAEFLDRAANQLKKYFTKTMAKHLTRCTPTDKITEQTLGLHNNSGWMAMSADNRAACLELFREYNSYTNTACITESHWAHCRNTIGDFALSGVAHPEVWRRFVELKAQNRTTREIVRELDNLNAIVGRTAVNTPKHPSKGYSTTHNQQPPPTEVSTTTCHHCKKTGHKRKDCRARRKLKCTYCKNYGHVEKDCRKMAAESQAVAVASTGPSPLGGQPAGAQPQSHLPPQTNGPPPPNHMSGTAQQEEHLNFRGEF